MSDHTQNILNTSIPHAAIAALIKHLKSNNSIQKVSLD